MRSDGRLPERVKALRKPGSASSMAGFGQINHIGGPRLARACPKLLAEDKAQIKHHREIKLLDGFSRPVCPLIHLTALQVVKGLCAARSEGVARPQSLPKLLRLIFITFFPQRRKRSRATGSRDTSDGRNLSAALRPRAVSSALKTTPMPPPSLSIIL